MNQHREGTRLPDQLFDGGANNTQDNVAQGLESVGVPQGIALWIGHYHVSILIVVVLIFFLVRYFPWIGTKSRPPKKKGKKKRR